MIIHIHSATVHIKDRSPVRRCYIRVWHLPSNQRIKSCTVLYVLHQWKVTSCGVQLASLWLLDDITPLSPLYKQHLLAWWKGNVLHSWLLCTTSLPSR